MSHLVDSYEFWCLPSYLEHFMFTWGGGLAKWWAHSWTHNLVVPGSSLTLSGHLLDSFSVLPHSNRRFIPTGLYQLAWTFHYKQTSTSNYYFFFYFTSLSGLKTVIGELPPASSSLAANICRRITGRLTNAIAKVGGLKCILYIVLLLVLNTVLLPWFQSTDVSVQLEALDILGDLLSRFGGK